MQQNKKQSTKVSRQKIKEVTSLIKKIQQLTGKKVIFEDIKQSVKESKEQKIEKIKSLVKMIESKTGKKVVFGDIKKTVKKSIEEVKKSLKEMPYEPYNGSAGPEKNQAAENTLILFNKLQSAGVPCRYAKKTWDGDEKMIILGNDRARTYISYDKLGFTADGPGGVMMEEKGDMIDQIGIDETFQILLKYYSPKK